MGTQPENQRRIPDGVKMTTTTIPRRLLSLWKAPYGTYIHVAERDAKRTLCGKLIEKEWKKKDGKPTTSCITCITCLIETANIIREYERKKERERDEKETYGKPVSKMNAEERKKYLCRTCQKYNINNGYPTIGIVTKTEERRINQGIYGLSRGDVHLLLDHRDLSQFQIYRKRRIAKTIAEYLTDYPIFGITPEAAKEEADRLAKKIVEVI